MWPGGRWGGFPYERTRMSKTLRNRYVLGKHPARFATQEAGGALDAQDVTLYNRSWVGDLLARFEMGKLERLVLTWKLEDDSVHLVLLHEKGAEGECFLAAVVQDTTRQIDYLVANVADYLDEGDGRKAPLIPFPEPAGAGLSAPRGLLPHPGLFGLFLGQSARLPPHSIPLWGVFQRPQKAGQGGLRCPPDRPVGRNLISAPFS